MGKGIWSCEIDDCEAECLTTVEYCSEHWQERFYERSGGAEVLVETEPGESATIYDKHGEIIHYTNDEWVEDTESVTALVSAVVVALTLGPQHLREIVKRPVPAN